MPKRFEQVWEGEWDNLDWTSNEEMCCGCHMVHSTKYRISENNKLQRKLKVDRAKTYAARRRAGARANDKFSRYIQYMKDLADSFRRIAKDLIDDGHPANSTAKAFFDEANRLDPPKPPKELWLQSCGNGLWQEKFEGLGQHFIEQKNEKDN